MPNRIYFLSLLFAVLTVYGQAGSEIHPQLAEGLPVRSVNIYLFERDSVRVADGEELENFYRAFGIRPGVNFNLLITDLAVKRILQETAVASATYSLYNFEVNGPVDLVLKVTLTKEEPAEKPVGDGMVQKGSIKAFPVISETSSHKFQFIFNGGAGVFNDINALFSKGAEFTQGNPIADNPAGKGLRFWSEYYLEPGLAGIIRLGHSPAYMYASVSGLVTVRNTTDIYSDGPAAYFDIERAYGGILLAGIGKNKEVNLDISGGRNFYQLDDGFLFSKYSGSANAGGRASLFLNSRTAFQKTALLSMTRKNMTVKAFFLEPEELYKEKEKQKNNRFLGIGGFYNNKGISTGVTLVSVVGGSAVFGTPAGTIPRKGIFVVNPKFWMTDIGGTGLFLKSEYAFQSHYKASMIANAIYLGAGYNSNWKCKPGIYYRYAFMQGDDPGTSRYGRFDPFLTGGLGNWVQGLNFRKINGNGNIQSHRIEVKANVLKRWELSFDYFFLRAHLKNNQGGLAPIANLQDERYGHEFTLTSRYFIGSHFMLLGVLSHTLPGQALEQAFADTIYNWTTIQLSFFMFF